MPICNERNCFCAIGSSGTVSVSGSGASEDPWILETAEVSSITALEEAVATLQSQVGDALAAIAELESQMDNRMSATSLVAIGDGSTVGPTSSTTALTVLSLTLVDPGVSGRWILDAQCVFSKTVATDRFGLDFQNAAASFVQSDEDADFASIQISGYAATTGSDITLNLRLTRQAGSGTATAQAGSQRAITAIFVPNPA